MRSKRSKYDEHGRVRRWPLRCTCEQKRELSAEPDAEYKERCPIHDHPPREGWIPRGGCSFCGQEGHNLTNCPHRPL